jgi:molybdopterin-containing oxidoreductase family membrane subunit
MKEHTFPDINKTTFDALEAPPLIYYIVLALLSSGIAAFFLTWLYQMKTGMGVAGINHPTGWGVYIANFVFWIGIAHSGTLISAILYLVRARYRDAVSRSAEAMTIFAIAIAGLFPLIHLGRFWVFYYILPYPNERQIWPNFISALLWDVTAILTYLTVSIIFFFVGLIPDLAAAREYFREHKGEDHPRTRLYKILSLGWIGAASQWRHYGRAYLFFAALATPLVISVHSIVSWDFAMSLLPGWHTTIFAPYFVAGAIHSGLAMVLVLMIPMRKLLKLQTLIGVRHFEKVAQTMLVTAAILGYSYGVLPFMSWYSKNIFDWQFEKWRMTDFWAWAYWGVILLNVLIPSLLTIKKIRTNLRSLFIIGLVVVMGMWIERFFLIPSALMHDFLPHNWGPYIPTWVEATITIGSACLFFFLFIVFTKSLPVIPLSDVKTQTAIQQLHENRIEYHHIPIKLSRRSPLYLVAIYDKADKLIVAVNKLIDAGVNSFDVFSPQRMAPLMQTLGYTTSPVAWWTLAGALSGIASGYALPLYSALRNHLIVGGKHPVSLIPYSIIAFELMVLFGSIANLIAFIHYARLPNRKMPPWFDPQGNLSRMGIAISCDDAGYQRLQDLLQSTEPQTMKRIENKK